MLDEDEDMKPLTTLDQLPTASGFTCQEIEKTLEENKIVEQHCKLFSFLYCLYVTLLLVY